MNSGENFIAPSSATAAAGGNTSANRVNATAPSPGAAIRALNLQGSGIASPCHQLRGLRS